MANNARAFNVQSFIGSEIAEFKGGKQPFTTAQLVAKVLWSWGPAHSRSADYFVSGDRRGWTLWEVGRDAETGRRMFAQVACGWPRQGATAKHAAEQLLLAAWRDQCFWDEDLRNPDVVERGLLTEAELKQIAELAMTSSDQRSNCIVITKN